MDEKKEKWYLKTSVFVVALLCVGPLALPLLWINQHFSMRMKVIISVIVIILSYYMIAATMNSLKALTGYYSQLGL